MKKSHLKKILLPLVDNYSKIVGIVENHQTLHTNLDDKTSDQISDQIYVIANYKLKIWQPCFELRALKCIQCLKKFKNDAVKLNNHDIGIRLSLCIKRYFNKFQIWQHCHGIILTSVILLLFFVFLNVN
uniref:(northern house mosquito) hypothetical protein n=1 Tax=Culex pipiens TaxID=7175 RepID=A0A8D8CFN7_CULPI